MKTNQIKTSNTSILLALILFLLSTLACGFGSDAIEEIEGAAENVAAVQAEVEQLEEMATAVSETANATPETGPGTTLDNPLDINFDQPYTGQVNGNNIERFYRLTLPAGAILNVAANNAAESGGDIAFRLVTMAGGIPSPIVEETVPVGTDQQIRFMTGDDGGGTYLLLTRGGFLGADDYTFTASMTMQDDAGSGGDAVAEETTGTDIRVGTFNGMLGGSDKADSYRFNVPARAIVRVSLANSSESENTLTTEVTTNGAHVRYRTDWYAAPGNGVRFAADALDEGVYNVHISGDTAKEATYTLTVEITPQNDAGSGGDAGEDFPTATQINMNQVVEGFRGEGEKDCYQFATTADQPLSIEMNSLTDEFLGGRPIPRVHDAEGKTLAVGGGPVPGASETVTGTAVGTETFICIEGGGNGAPYSFTIAGS